MQQMLTEQQQCFPEWTGNSPGTPASSTAYSASKFSQFLAHSTAVTPDESAPLPSGTVQLLQTTLIWYIILYHIDRNRTTNVTAVRSF
jgi:hypothetical protein